ncbi:MAG: TfpX/TfpZ family type IV pilin accessory protein [Pseudomonadota bacterium]
MLIHSFNRYNAFFLHLLLSAVVVGISAAIVFLCWYPGLLAYASGVADIFLILASVDVVLGPLITLIVFNVKKKELKRDLSIIIFVQIAALLYGVNTLFSARPVFIVFNADRFDVVYANEISDDAKLQSKYEELWRGLYFGPKFVGARLPKDEQLAKKIMIDAVSGGKDIQLMPQFYVPFDEMKEERRRAARSLDELKVYNKENILEVNNIINQFTSKSDKFGYVPLIGKTKNLVTVVNIDTAEIIIMNKLKPLDDSYGASAVDLQAILKKNK